MEDLRVICNVIPTQAGSLPKSPPKSAPATRPIIVVANKEPWELRKINIEAPPWPGKPHPERSEYSWYDTTVFECNQKGEWYIQRGVLILGPFCNLIESVRAWFSMKAKK